MPRNKALARWLELRRVPVCRRKISTSRVKVSSVCEFKASSRLMTAGSEFIGCAALTKWRDGYSDAGGAVEIGAEFRGGEESGGDELIIEVTPAAASSRYGATALLRGILLGAFGMASLSVYDHGLLGTLFGFRLVLA